jgi:hypothetical protein
MTRDEDTYALVTAFHDAITSAYKSFLREKASAPRSSCIALERVMNEFEHALRKEFPALDEWKSGDKSTPLGTYEVDEQYESRDTREPLPPLTLEYGSRVEQLAYDALRKLDLREIRETLLEHERLSNTADVIMEDKENFTLDQVEPLLLEFNWTVLAPLKVVANYVLAKSKVDIPLLSELNKLVISGVLTPEYEINYDTKETGLNRDVIGMFHRVLCQRSTFTAHLALVDTFNTIKAGLSDHTKKLYRSDLERLTHALSK